MSTFNTVRFYLILTEVNTLLRDVALNCPDYYDRSINLMGMLKEELTDIAKIEKESRDLLCKQYRHERNN
jgi:hypothetical protein